MNVVAGRQTNWFTYFPEDYRWSAAMVDVIGCSGMGGSDIGEVDRLGRRLRGKVGDDEAGSPNGRGSATRSAPSPKRPRRKATVTLPPPFYLRAAATTKSARALPDTEGRGRRSIYRTAL